MSELRPIDGTLFVWPPANGSSLLQLIAGECAHCGLVVFPRQDDCPRCMGDTVQTHLLPTRGTLWTFTTQGYPPKSPPYLGPTDAAFEPFAVGYVELGAVRVQGRITVGDPSLLRIGMEMDVVALPFRTSAAEVVTYAFQPVQHDDVEER